jgi:hypothetical protein
MGEELPEKLPHRVTLPGRVKKARIRLYVTKCGAIQPPFPAWVSFVNI